MGLGYNGDDVIIKIGVDMREVQSDLKQLQNTVAKAFESMEREAAENASQMEGKFKDSFEDMSASAKLNASKVNKSLEKVGGYVKGGLSKAFGGLSTVIAGAFTVDKIKNFTVGIIEAAADLEAMEAAFEQVFVTASGDFTQEATKNIEKMCDKWDMEINTLKGDYSAFSAQFKGLGMEMGDAMEYSNTSMELAADAAAMFNIPMKDAIDSVRSFIKGNYVGGESIQIFGSQAMLASYAVEKGLVKDEKAFKALGEAEKQMIRIDFAKYQYDLAGTTGQAAREADLYANQLTKLKQKWTDFKAQLGEKAMEGAVNIFKGLSESLEKIDTEKIGGFFGDLIGMLGEGFGAGLEVFTEWINSVNWEWFGIQLEEICGLLKEFGEGAIAGLSESLTPIAEGFLAVWDSLVGVDDINTDNMDSTNLALVRIKPIFEWFADHGEEVGKGLGAVIKALAAWKLFKLEVAIGATLAEMIAAGGIGAWLKGKLKTKLLGEAAAGAAGEAAGGAGGAGAAAGGVSLGSIIGGVITVNYVIAIGYLIKHLTPKEANENNKERIENMSKGQLSDKQLNDGKNYDWSNSPITKAWNKFWKTNEETQRTSLQTMEEGSNQFAGRFNTNWSGTWKTAETNQKIKGISISNENKSFWSRFGGEWDKGWKATEQSQRDSGTTMESNSRGFWSRFGSSWSTGWRTNANTQRTTATTMKQGNASLWNEISNSKWGKKLGTMCGNTKKSWSTWGSDIKKNWKGVKKEWGQFWNDIKNSKFANGLKSFFNKTVDVMNSGIKGFLNGMNALIKGVNFVYKKLTNKKKGLIGEIQVSKWMIPKLAKGTDNWGGGTALVGEAGRELVSDPRMGTFMADRPMLLNLSKGAMVLRNSKTEKLLGAMGIKAFAKGTNEGIFDNLLDGFGTLWNYMTNPKKLLDKILDKVGFNLGEGSILSPIVDGVKNIFKGDFLLDKIKGWFDEAIPDVSGVGSAKAWRPHILKAAAFFGEKLSEREVEGIIAQIARESGGNQKIIQSPDVIDVNTLNGNPARGLLQYIPQTFNRYKVSGFGDIYNGYHQLLAFFNNSSWRKNLPYGKSGWGPTGSRRKAANGILVDGATPLTVGEKGAEAVVPLSNARALKPFGQAVTNALVEEVANNSGGGVYEFTIPVIVDGKQIAVATAKYTKEELDKMEARQNRRNGNR